MAAIAGTIGLWLLIVVLRSRGRWIEGSETGISSSWGRSFDFDSVESLDKKRWNKGIAKVKYREGKRKKQFVIDNYGLNAKRPTRFLRGLESKSAPTKLSAASPNHRPRTRAKRPPEEGAALLLCRRPSDDLVRRTVAAQRNGQLTYSQVGLTRESQRPPGFKRNHAWSVIGTGEACFRLVSKRRSPIAACSTCAGLESCSRTTPSQPARRSVRCCG